MLMLMVQFLRKESHYMIEELIIYWCQNYLHQGLYGSENAVQNVRLFALNIV